MRTETQIEALPPHALRCLAVRLWRDDETEAFLALLEEHHYLGAPDGRTRRLSQVVTFEERAVALLVWNSAARSLAGRERFIGWDRRTCKKRLGYLVQNNRFCLLVPKGSTANLASRVLKLCLDHLPQAWEKLWGVKPLLAETFVDPEGHAGTCYRACGWLDLGRTAGFARVSKDYYERHDRPKHLWVKELHGNARQLLRDPSQPLPGEKTGPKARVYAGMPVKAPVALSLSEALQQVKDPRGRQRREYPLGAVLATTVLALACGAKSVSDIFRFCQDLTSPQRRNLGFRPNRKAPRVVPPPGEDFWRKILRRVDPGEIAQALDRWRLSQKEELPGLLSIDGKVIGNNLATLVSLVDAADGSPLSQAAAPGNGQEQRLGNSLIEALPEEALEGKTVSGDALYCQKDLTRTIVQEKGGHVLLQLKGNQKHARDIVTDLMEKNAPPFCP
jgi:hypothetical protein